MSQPIVAKPSIFTTGPNLRAGPCQRGCWPLLVLVVLSGCRSTGKTAPWSPPALASPALSAATKSLTTRWGDPDSQAPAPVQLIQQASAAFPKQPHRDKAFALAELHYLAGTKAAAAQSEKCVDHFY